MKKPSFIFISFVSLAICACTNPLIYSILQIRTITFYSNGGSSVPSQTLFKDEKISLPRTPTRDGYFFGGWFKENDNFYNIWNFDYIPVRDMTLYAEWHQGSKQPTANLFSINGTGYFEYDGKPKVVTVTPLGGISVGKITVYYEEQTTTSSPNNNKKPNAPTNPGTYKVTFDVTSAEGWNQANDLYAGMLYIQ